MAFGLLPRPQRKEHSMSDQSDSDAAQRARTGGNENVDVEGRMPGKAGGDRTSQSGAQQKQEPGQQSRKSSGTQPEDNRPIDSARHDRAHQGTRRQPEGGMQLQKFYSALLAKDLPAAEGWYSKLLGRGPDYRPMDTLIQWDLSAQGGLQLATDDNLAGHGALFLEVGDIAKERQRLRDLGISLSEDIQGDYSTLAQVRDPDGNQVTLATPPSPYPPA
jgi:hypothetical protein